MLKVRSKVRSRALPCSWRFVQKKKLQPSGLAPLQNAKYYASGEIGISSGLSGLNLK